MKRVSKMAAMLVVLLASMCLSAQANSGPDIHMTSVKLNEDLNIGAFAFKIDATGEAPLKYAISGTNAFYFKVNEQTGDVTVANPMDREKTETFSIFVEVSNTVTTSKVVVIILNDANDNMPIFNPATYSLTVREDTPLNTLLFTVTATDLDYGPARTVVYKIDSVIPGDGMKLFSVSPSTGEVTLQGQLNATSKSNFYQIKFNGSDQGGNLNGEFVIQSSSAFATVTVTDVADLDPQFINLPYLVHFKENQPAGTSVFKVEAFDPDTGINDKIVYSIAAASEPDLFQIDTDTGVITTKKMLDREEYLERNAVVNLTVMARESNKNVYGEFASTSTNVSITIMDVNDNKPQFYNCKADTCTLATSFSGDINENAPPGEAVKGMKIMVKDLDAESNAKFILELAGPDKDTFTTFMSAGASEANVEIRVRNSKDLDYEKKTTMSVEVIVIDAGEKNFRSTATVTIHINDVNDNYPTFPNEIYNLEVKEHSPDGYIIANITATDPDTADKNNITYKLLPDSIQKYIDVDQKTGCIMVANEQLLDREVISSITATLEATDTDEKSGRTILVITLLDINDMTPFISRKSYLEFMREGPDGELSVSIQATDGDEEGNDNSKIQYSIAESEFSNNFTIDKDTGLLQNKGPLDREAIDPSLEGKIVLYVNATDMGVPPRSTDVMVIVTVEDINDNKPIFRKKHYTFSVKESKMGAFVGLVFADDADQTVMNNRISFRITDGSFGNFLVTTSAEERGSGYIGNVTVDPDVELDYEQEKKLYNLKVEATDMGINKDYATVEVHVLDVNDERPVLPKDVTLHVPENTANLGEVGKITAKDPDTNSSLIYELLSTQCQCNGTLGPCDEEWFTLEPTGAITVNKEFVIDYEKCDQVVLEIQAVDVYTEKGLNNSLPGFVNIIIDDINDNAPTFIKQEGVFVVLSENAQKDTQVAEVLATDQDSGSNKVVTFDISSVHFINTNNESREMEKLFKVDTKAEEDLYRGEIRCIGTLDSSLKGKYLVMADAKSGNLTTTTPVEIYTIDKSYRVGLRFESSVAEVTANLVQIKAALEGATKSVVHILEVVAENSRQRAAEITLLGAYFIHSNGSALGSNTVELLLQNDPFSAGILRKYGLTYIVSGATEAKKVHPIFLILIGVVAGLVIVLVVMITSLFCTQRNYKRKLKAAEAMNTSSMKAENLTSGVVLPGTNKYHMEGANPMLNLDINVATDLDFDESNFSDKVSLNSLDCDMDIMEKDNMPLTVIKEEDEEAPYNRYMEPLSAALAQQDKNKENDVSFAFSNPTLDTTDL